MEEKKQHFWHIMLYYFKKGKNATETHKKICAVYGEGAVTDRTCQKWFAKFRAGGFSLDDAPRSGRPVEADSDQIKTLIEAFPGGAVVKNPPANAGDTGLIPAPGISHMPWSN